MSPNPGLTLFMSAPQHSMDSGDNQWKACSYGQELFLKIHLEELTGESTEMLSRTFLILK